MSRNFAERVFKAAAIGALGVALLASAAQAASVYATVRDPVGAGASPATPATLASGMAADGAAVVFIVLTSAVIPSSATVTTTNEAVPAIYDLNYAMDPPVAGTNTLAVAGSNIVALANNQYVICMIQAPDILVKGADSNLPKENQPIAITINIPNIGNISAQLTLYPPPVLFVPGLWGTPASLTKIKDSVKAATPFTAVPSKLFLNTLSYSSDQAFDSSAVQSAISNEISNVIIAPLRSAGIAVGRVDVVAHSMGGLVARSFSAQSGYNGPPSRTLGLVHQVITIDTPEQGSGLATFLFNNANTPFSAGANNDALRVKNEACATATTVQDCFNTLNSSITNGGVASLAPGSPDLAGLPSANIPNATWKALGATASQSGFDSSAQVYELNELVNALCPGQSFCRRGKKQVNWSSPVVADLLGSAVNDAIVTQASQTAGASNPVILAGLSHSPPADPGFFGRRFYSLANVLDSTAVDTQVVAWLANTAAPLAPVAEAASTQPLWPGFVPGTDWREEDSRLPLDIPTHVLAMGAPFDLRLNAPWQKIGKVYVSEGNEFYTPFDQFLEAPVERAPDGGAIVHVTPFLLGRGHIRVTAYFRDYVRADQDFKVEVGPPTEAPLGFWADNPGDEPPYPRPKEQQKHLAINKGLLQPFVAFASAPTQHVWLNGGVTYRVLDNGQAPAASVDAQGNLAALHPGTSTVEVRLGQFTATIEVLVEGY